MAILCTIAALPALAMPVYDPSSTGGASTVITQSQSQTGKALKAQRKAEARARKACRKAMKRARKAGIHNFSCNAPSGQTNGNSGSSSGSGSGSSSGSGPGTSNPTTTDEVTEPEWPQVNDATDGGGESGEGVGLGDLEEIVDVPPQQPQSSPPGPLASTPPPTNVPEPTSLARLGLGLVGLGTARRRR